MADFHERHAGTWERIEDAITELCLSDGCEDEVSDLESLGKERTRRGLRTVPTARMSELPIQERQLHTILDNPITRARLFTKEWSTKVTTHR